MGFLGVYTAIYDYAPHQPGELAIQEGDLLFVLEKDTDDDWWKAKKRASSPDEEEPTGLIPNNYIEEVGVLELSYLSSRAINTKSYGRLSYVAPSHLASTDPGLRTQP